jgi:hypothetical protein
VISPSNADRFHGLLSGPVRASLFNCRLSALVSASIEENTFARILLIIHYVEQRRSIRPNDT